MKKYILLLLCLIALSGCGAGGGSAPPGSTITIQPSSVDVEYAGTDFEHYQDFIINLKDSEGTPIYDGKITISYIWATPNYANCVRFVDLNNPSFSPFDVYTDRFGNYYLRVYFAGTTPDGATCSHKGDLGLISGDAYTTATISVNQ